MLTHINKDGYARMVEVSDKDDTKRVAVAKGKILMEQNTLNLIKEGQIKKGEVLSVAQVAGICGAKKTSDIIPMCHNIFLTGVDLNFNYLKNGIEIEASTKTVGKTGVEMEALTAVSTAALTIYDMCKAVDKTMQIQDIHLVSKTGGKSDYCLKQ